MMKMKQDIGVNMDVSYLEETTFMEKKMEKWLLGAGGSGCRNSV